MIEVNTCRCKSDYIVANLLVNRHTACEINCKHSRPPFNDLYANLYNMANSTLKLYHLIVPLSMYNFKV